STQPVDLTGNPFAADEPTMTAAHPPVSSAPPGGATPPPSNRTQPMRAIAPNPVDALAPTVPPPVAGPGADKPVAKKSSDGKAKENGKDGDGKLVDWAATTDPKGEKIPPKDDDGDGDGPTEVAV